MSRWKGGRRAARPGAQAGHVGHHTRLVDIGEPPVPLEGVEAVLPAAAIEARPGAEAGPTLTLEGMAGAVLPALALPPSERPFRDAHCDRLVQHDSLRWWCACGASGLTGRSPDGIPYVTDEILAHYPAGLSAGLLGQAAEDERS